MSERTFSHPDDDEQSTNYDRDIGYGHADPHDPRSLFNKVRQQYSHFDESEGSVTGRSSQKQYWDEVGDGREKTTLDREHNTGLDDPNVTPKFQRQKPPNQRNKQP
jgi:hypothetical protein